MNKRPPRLPRSRRPEDAQDIPVEPESSPQPAPEQHQPGPAAQKEAGGPTPLSRRRRVVEQLTELRDSVQDVLGHDIPETGTRYRTAEQMRAAAERVRAKRGTETVPARNLSGRFIALIIISVLMVLTTLPSINTYIKQQAEIAELQADIDQRKQQQEDLHAEIARWDDPAYVKQQARDRINLVMPGERKYLVIGEMPETDDAPAESPHDVRADLPWADALLDSIRRAGTD
ncbi:FtsB family cell division protein [Micrococcoides hystricis]|uniref:Septum formation initiator family protein n=1 Tax=Micrococcoides hystricis TaxID=1572761 RepID=A0ABV6P926_9MICC